MHFKAVPLNILTWLPVGTDFRRQPQAPSETALFLFFSFEGCILLVNKQFHIFHGLLTFSRVVWD